MKYRHNSTGLARIRYSQYACNSRSTLSSTFARALGGLAVLGGALALPSIAFADDFTAPGSYTYTVPANTVALQVIVKGGAGGAGGWDDVHGGEGAGGSQVSTSIAVKGGETVTLVVGGGGGGAIDGASGAVPGGGVSLALPGAGGNGGKPGTAGSSPSGAGGGGASYLQVNGAMVLWCWRAVEVEVAPTHVSQITVLGMATGVLLVPLLPMG